MFKIGIFVFFGIHLVPFFTNLKASLISKLGAGPYKGLFSLISLVGLLLIIFGYQSENNTLYSTNTTAYTYSKIIMAVSFTLFVASNLPTHIKRITRHPLSLSIAFWSILHLAVNPDSSSIILFGSFLFYAIVSAILSELRTNQTAANKKQASAKLSLDVFCVVLGILFTYLAYNYHSTLAGVALG